MASRITFGEVKELGLHQAEMQNSQYPDPIRLNHIANIALSKTRDLLIESYEDYWRETANFALVSGQSDYELPAGYYKTIKVYYKSGNRRFPLERFTLDGISGYSENPVVSGTIDHWYIPEYVPLTDDENFIEFPVPSGWEDYASLLIATRLRIREETEASALKGELMEAKQHIIDMATERDSGTMQAVGDVYNRWGTAAASFPNDGSWLRYRIMGRNLVFVNYEYLGV